jgi:hypothetical protein
MKSLKEAASLALKLSLDLSRGDLIRLKSPMIATGPGIEETICSRDERKAGLRSWVHGPYTFTIEKARLSARKENEVVIEKSSTEWLSNSRSWSSQAVTRPPEAPTESLQTKERRVGGKKEEARKGETFESLDS